MINENSERSLTQLPMLPEPPEYLTNVVVDQGRRAGSDPIALAPALDLHTFLVRATDVIPTISEV
jgi:hypothetical protein